MWVVMRCALLLIFQLPAWEICHSNGQSFSFPLPSLGKVQNVTACTAILMKVLE